MNKAANFIPIKSCKMEMPNGLQWFNNELYVIDQKSDDIYVIDEFGVVKKTIKTICENGSGITIGDDHIWLASNGKTGARNFRFTDTHLPWIMKLNLHNGELDGRFPIPYGPGVHGLEWDNGLIWLTAFDPNALLLIEPKKFEVVFKFNIDQSPHGLAIQEEFIWCSDRKARNIVKYEKSSGKIVETILVPNDGPDPHGLSIKNNILWYSDAAHPNPVRPYPEIGWIETD